MQVIIGKTEHGEEDAQRNIQDNPYKDKKKKKQRLGRGASSCLLTAKTRAEGADVKPHVAPRDISLTALAAVLAALPLVASAPALERLQQRTRQGQLC